MAESWIKMRGSLMTNPKVIKMARLLLQDPEFLEWYAHDGVTLDASRSVTRRHVTVVTRVTVGALTPLWAQVNECAGTDFVLPDASLFEVDEMAGVPGFGRALEGVCWLRVLPDSGGVEFPNFTEHNTVGKERSTGAKTQAERAKDYRERAKQKALEGVTIPVTEKRDASRDTVTTEKSREEKKRTPSSSTAKLPTCHPDQVVAIYHEVLPELPGVRVMDKAREKAIRDRWEWVLSSTKPDGTRRATTTDEAFEWFRSYFLRARDNDFLMGRTPRSGEHANWKPDIEYLMKSSGLKQVLEKTNLEATA